METVDIFCTNILPTNTAFGVRGDNGEQVFIPSTVTTASGISVHDVVTAVLVPNTLNPKRTPWFATRIVPRVEAPEASAEPAELGLPDRIAAFIEEQLLYVTTTEVAEEFGVDSTMASNLLLGLFRQGRVARAEVYARPGQQRASACLWAKNVSRFVEEVEA